MQKLPLSVTIVTKNEADRITRTINAVIEWVDEVLVVDSGSTDGTQEIASQLGARVVYNSWKGFGFQKKYAATIAKNDWIFNIDADEEVSETLRDEIKNLFTPMLKNPASTLPHNGYWVRILNVLPFESKPRRWATCVTMLRLYNRTKASSVEKDIYDQVTVHEGTEGWLKSGINHYSLRNHSHTVEKINSYTTHHANDVFRSGRKIPAARIVIEPFFAFLKAYIYRKYFIYGVDGFVQAIMYSFARTLRLAKIRELEMESQSSQKTKAT